ncbi:nesprin-1 isoform X3 [Corythoichthys intestinalis]|uniref:nesprin-1 isoform X3 n=1 Tax=Corythoichthys intestinalis TaxID=161448 RepID=UPI0025A67453|nr:nesprin-1 isoform X3 [Corythoichthys intestinalis]
MLPCCCAQHSNTGYTERADTVSKVEKMSKDTRKGVDSEVVPVTSDSNMELKHISNSRPRRHHGSTEPTMQSLDALGTEQAWNSVQQQAGNSGTHTLDHFKQTPDAEAYHQMHFPCPDLLMDMHRLAEGGDKGSHAAIRFESAKSKNDSTDTILQRKHEVPSFEKPLPDVSPFSSSESQSSSRCINTKLCDFKSTNDKLFSGYQEIKGKLLCGSSESSGITANFNLVNSDSKGSFPDAKNREISDYSFPKGKTHRNKYLIPERCNDSKAEEESELLLSLEAREMTEVDAEMSSTIRIEEMESDQEKTCESPGKASYKHSFTMQDLFSEVQEIVERNDIINRTTRMDLNWYLQSSPSEAEIRLVRAVQKVLVCRYLPAQLNVTAMAEQMNEAEDYKNCVLEQVALMKSTSLSQLCGPNVLKRLEAQWSKAVLDASATVQVKTAQMGEVIQYHKLLGKIKALLEEVDGQKKTINLHPLESSAQQAEQLQALLQRLNRSEEMWEELLALSSQLAVHLSDAESSGVLLAQLGDVQDAWRLLSGHIKRALWQSANSTCQSSVLMKEVRRLKDKIAGVQESINSYGECHDTKSILELFCLSEDLKMCYQIYGHLQSFSDALFQCSIGQKEKKSIELHLEELRTLLQTAQIRPSVCGDNPHKQFKEWITWAKQMEYRITMGQKLSLFPEEARIQIVEMKKYQTDSLSRRSKMKLEEMREDMSDMNNEDYRQGLKVVEDLYQTMTENLDNVIDRMKKNLQERETLLDHIDSIDVWLVETKANKDPSAYVENVSRVDISSLENKLKRHQEVADEIERHLALVESLETKFKEVSESLSPVESCYIVNRLSGIWTEFDGLLAQESATSWHLAEMIHERTSSGEELATIKDSLKNIYISLDQLHFPMTQEAILTIAHLEQMLMEHQCQVQEIQHSDEVERSSLLCTIGELQERCKVLSFFAFEQDKYLQLKKQMEYSMDTSEEQIQHARDRTLSLGERFKLFQALLVDLPLMKTQCQEAADQLEVIAQELNPTELDLERQNIRYTVDKFVTWEHTASDEIKHLEGKLLLGLRFSSELPTLMAFFQTTTQELQSTEPVSPDERAIDVALQRRWVIWKNMESGMRMLRALASKGKINLQSHSDLHSFREAAMHECHIQMECLSKTRESLKDYQWAAQGAIHFLHNAEMTFLSAPGGFLDCTEEQTQTQQAIEALEEGFVAHIQHLVQLVPQQACLSCSKTQDLHIGILSQLLVGRAILEAQAQLRLESLQRCALRQQSHRVCHSDVQLRLTEFEAKLSACAAEEVTSYNKCTAQHKQSKDLMEGVYDLARKTEELRARCPMQGCGVGKDGELGALWRRWVSLRRGVGLLMAQTDQRVEEWKDITTSVEQCRNSLAILQTKVPDSLTVILTQDELQRLVSQAEMQQVGLEQEQQTLASLEHCLEHALGWTTSKDPSSLPGPFGVTLVKIQENIKCLKERNLHVIAVAHMEERQRHQFEERIGEVEKSMITILPMLDNDMNSSQHQELTKDLTNQRVELKSILVSLQEKYTDIPPDFGKRIQKLEESVEEAEKKLIKQSEMIRKLACQVTELISGLEQVKISLGQKSTTLLEAQSALKHVWDRLDSCHSRLMLLENDVQDLVEEKSDQAHLFMDQLTRPMQLYQEAVQMAEHRTAFLNKIPAFLQEFEDLLSSANCWFDEAQAWLNTPCSFPTSKGLHSHARSLQLVLDDSTRIRSMLKDFRPVLAEISTVCDLSAQEMKMEITDQQVEKMQKCICELMEQLKQAVEVVDTMENELQAFEENIPKIRTILSSMNNSSITTLEHLQNQKVILDNVHSMQNTLADMEHYKEDLSLPQETKESLLVFSRIKVLLQVLNDLEHLTRQQTILLEDKRDRTCADVSHLDGDRRYLVQEAFEESNSEDGLDEDESCHSSSSDTLTCSIPEDPEDTLDASEVQSKMTDMEGQSDDKVLETVSAKVSAQTDSEVETSLNNTELSGLHSKMLEQEIPQCGLINPETRLDAETDSSEVHGLKIMAPDSLIIGTISGNEDFASVVASEKNSTLQISDMCPPNTNIMLNQPAVHLINSVTLVTATRQSTATYSSQVQSGLTNNDCTEGKQQNDYSPSVVSSILVGPSKDCTDQQQWSQLHLKVSQKLETLQNFQQEHQNLITYDKVAKVPEGEIVSTGSVSVVLQHANESMTMLSKIVSSPDDPDLKEQLLVMTQQVLKSLDALTDFLSIPGGLGDKQNQLRILQHECISFELVRMVGLLHDVESKIRPILQNDEPDAFKCLTFLQKSLKTVQLIITSFSNPSSDPLDIKSQHQELFSNQLCFMGEIQLGHHEIIPCQKEASMLECLLGRHERESSVEKAMLQRATGSLLHGISSLLDLGEQSMAERQARPVQNITQLHSGLHRDEKFQQVLGAHLTFIQHLFHRKQEVLQAQEDEQAQLDVRGKALLQQMLQQEVASQYTLQEWTRWEDNSSRFGRLLDNLEVCVSRSEAEGEDEEESHIQQRLHTCQQTLVEMEVSRAALGLLVDQTCGLQTDPTFATSVKQAGGALELRWRRLRSRVEEKVQHWSDIWERWVRFQTDFASVSKWLLDANKHLTIWSELSTDASHVNQENVCKGFIKLLDFSIEMESMSAIKKSTSREATQLLHLREMECPGLRGCLAELEDTWCKVTSDLANIQDQLQQKLLLMWPPMQLLAYLEDWLTKQEVQLEKEGEKVHKVTDAAHIIKTLQCYQALKMSLVNGQPLLEFLSQTPRKVMGVDVQTLRAERIMYAEQLGALRQRWIHLQGSLESQIHGDQELYYTCSAREKQLKHLRHSVEQQKKQINQWKYPSSQTQIQKVLQEWEAVVGRIKDVAAALQGVKTTRVFVEKEHPCDVAFCEQAETVSLACEDLIQQMQTLDPVLQQVVKEWSCLDRNLREVSQYTSRVLCTMKLNRENLFSLKLTEEYLELLQQLQEMCEQAKKLWTDISKSFQILLKTLNAEASQSLNDRIEQERKRWEDMMDKLKEEHQKTDETLILWQKYNHAFDNSSLQLEHLWCQFSSFSPQQEPQTTVQLMENLSEDLQNSVENVLALSKPLIGCLKPLAQNVVQSESMELSLEVLLLNQAMSDTKKSFQEDLENDTLFHTQLEALEQQIQNIVHGEKSNMNDKDIVKQELLKLIERLPSVVDVSEMSGCVILNKEEKDTLHKLSKKWTHSVNHMSFLYRTLQRELQQSQDFHLKCQELTFILETLESELPESFNIQEKLAVQQRHQIEVITGQELLQSLLCNALKSVEEQTIEEKSELLTQVVQLRKRWFRALSLAGQHQSKTREQIHQWRIYKQGMKVLGKTLKTAETLLSSAQPSLTLSSVTSQRLAGCYQCLEKSLELHSSMLTDTLEAGKNLCETTSDSQSRSRLESDIRAIEGAWKHTNSLVLKRRALLSTTVQNWSQCQDGMSTIMCELDKLRTQLKWQLPEKMEESEQEERLQKTDLSLRLVAGGLKDLASMKTDLSPYVAAADSALLEQQLEQLHIQWEELCTKVSLRRQEIADHLNAWTIFNDKNKEFCDWLTQIENKVCQSTDLSIEEMVEKLKKDCMEEINLFSENKSHLKQLGEQLLLASDEAKQTQVFCSLQEINQRWHNLFGHIETRVTKLKETLLRVQQLDKNMSNLRSWLSRVEAELSRPITYSVCHHQEIQKRLAEQQELQRDIEQHTDGVTSVLNLCDLLLRDEDAAAATEMENDSLQETSRSLDQRWRTIRVMALDRRLRIEETWKLWCKFLEDYSQFEDWLKMAEKTASNPNTGDVLYTVAKEELKKFEGFQRQVHERLTQLELVNNQYRRLARENRTDRSSQLKAMVHEGNRRWDILHRRVAAILRRLKHFTSQREEFEGTRESMLVWLTELDLQLTNVEHFSESDVHHKIQQLSSFQKEIIVNTERIDGLIVFGESLIQRSSPEDAALIEEELEELHCYCQEVFSRLVRFHQRLSQPPIIAKEPEFSGTTFSLESSLELIGRPWLGRSQGSLPATPSHLLAFPLEHSGRETPVSVDSLPLEWDHTGDVGGSSSHEDDEDDGRHDEEGIYFSALSGRSMAAYDSPTWQPAGEEQTDAGSDTRTNPTLTSTPVKQSYLHQMSQCSDGVEEIKRVSFMLNDEEQPEISFSNCEGSDLQSGVIERWELLQAQSRNEQDADPRNPQTVTSDIDDVISWLDNIHPVLDRLQQAQSTHRIVDMATRAKEMKEMQKMFTRYKPIMLSANLRALEVPEEQEKLIDLNRAWSRASTQLHQWETGLRRTLMRCEEFHESLHSLLLWLAHAENRRLAVDIRDPETPVQILKQHHNSLTVLREELLERQTQQASLQTLWSQLQPDDWDEGSDEAQEKIHVTGTKLKLLLSDVTQDLSTLQQCLDFRGQDIPTDSFQKVTQTVTSLTKRESGHSAPSRPFFHRVLRAAFPFHLLFLFLLLLTCLVPHSDRDSNCTVVNNFARSFHPMLHYTNGPPPT